MRACTGWPAGWGSSIEGAGAANSVHGLPRPCPVVLQHGSTQAGSRTVHQRHGQPVSASAVRSWWPWQQGSRGTGVGDVPGCPSPASSLISEAPTSSSSSFVGGHLTSSGRCGVLEQQLPACSSASLEGSTHSTDSRPSLAQCLAQLLAVDVPEPSSPSQRLPAVTVRFVVPEFVTSPSQRLVVVGSVPALGSWDVSQGARMSWQKGHQWTAQVQLDPGWHGALEFKVVLVQHRHATWEPGSNRLLVVERPRPSMLGSHGSFADMSSISRSSSPEHSSSFSRGSSPGSPSSSPARSLDDVSYGSNTEQGPVLCVECEWGKAEAPAPALPPSLLCSASSPGRLADGLPVGAVSSAGEDGAAAVNSGAVVMANCQVVVPLLEQDSAAAKLACEDGGGGLQLMLVGSLPALGCWAPALGLPLACDESGMWRARLELPMGYPVHAKLVLWDSNANKARMWEPGPNRVIRLPDPPASMLQSRAATSLSSSVTLTAGGNAADASPGPALPSAGRMPFPVMADGEFMLLMHWSLPTFPHLVFLPSLDRHHSVQTQGLRTTLRPASRNQQQPSNVLCRFTLPHFPTHPNQHVVLVGGHAKLGDWDPTRGLRLQWGPGHSWQASVALPADAEVEAKVVMWDGAQYKWEEGPNRKLRPGALVRQVAPPGCWGEVLHCMYWGTPALGGRTPAVVVPHDIELAAATSWSNSSSSSSSSGSSMGAEAASIRLPAPSPSNRGSPGPSSPPATTSSPGFQEPSMALFGLSSLLTAAALGLRTDLDALFSSDSGSPGANGTHIAAAAANKAASQLASLEASLEAARAQVSELTALRQREVDSLRVQLAEGAKALAAEEDQVESLHAQLAQRGQELRSLTAQLARAEATAAAAVAAATTALNTSASLGGGLLRGFALSSVDQGQALTPDALVESMQQVQNGNGDGSQGMPAVAVATFQKLTEQLAVVQLEADSTRQALAEAQAMRVTEAAHLRAELSEAMASRHRESEAARVAAAAMALTHQQEISSLQGSLAEVQALRQREVTALRVRIDQIVARQEKETARLARQLGQACAAAEALEAQVLAQRSATAALSASGSAELRRLRSLLSVQASELEALRSQLADGHAAQVLGRLGNGSSNGNGSGHHQVIAAASNGSNGYASISANYAQASTNGDSNGVVTVHAPVNGNGHPSSNGHGVFHMSASGLLHASGDGLSGPLFERSGGSVQLAAVPAALETDVLVSDEGSDVAAASLPESAAVITDASKQDVAVVQQADAVQKEEQRVLPQAGHAGQGSRRSPAVVPASGPLARWIQQLTISGSHGQNGTSRMNNIVPLPPAMGGAAQQSSGEVDSQSGPDEEPSSS